MPPDARATAIVRALVKAYPDAKLALSFATPFELLMALILAAQCTDEKVNQLTAALLFRKYPGPREILAVPVEELEADIHPTGFFRNKAKALRECAHQLIERFDGKVPDRLEDLTSLYGVGRKTANILRGNAFGQAAIGVDTHVSRLAQRLDLTSNTEPDKIEADLCQRLRRDDWTRACYLIQTHGRKVCFARKPNCPECAIAGLCPLEPKTAVAPKEAPRPAFARRAK